MSGFKELEMIMYRYLRLGLLGLIGTISFSSCIRLSHHQDILYQTSTINALLEGVYDGDKTFTELAKHGDFGINEWLAVQFNCI